MPDRLHPFISICIPAYKRTHYLRRLLQSIANQTFQDFEVILSDDSNDDSVEKISKEFENKIPLTYIRNQPALGTPANWNSAIGNATGEWIKLMHDDDWFATATSLQTFADATRKGNQFIVSGYRNIDENGGLYPETTLTVFHKKLILRDPMILFNKNYIGQPSVTMVHRSVSAIYDERMKWRVDIDYYMQLLVIEKTFTHTPEILIHIGVNAMQVTNSCLNVPEIELPEGRMLLEKYGTQSLRSILVYDAWWRIIRNTGIRNKAMLYQHAFSWPDIIANMADAQSSIDVKRLQNGFLSKLYMMLQYLKSFGIKTDQWHSK